MVVRCPSCDRLSRDECICEWCRKPVPEEARQIAARATGEEGAGSPSAETIPAGAASEPARAESAAAAAIPMGDGPRREGDLDIDAVSRAEARRAATDVPEERADEPHVEAVEAETVEAVEQRQDRDTLVILLLIMFQLALTLYLGRLSSWWSLTGILWLVVGYGVKDRATWSLALPLVLFTLDIALLLFGIGPRERAGLLFLTPLDFVLYVLRLFIWGLIWRLRDELT